MSDQIKKPELVNAGEEKPLDEKVLDQVVGGGTATTTSSATDSSSPSFFKNCCAVAHFQKASIEL
jgi:hypothetical protein